MCVFDTCGPPIQYIGDGSGWIQVQRLLEGWITPGIGNSSCSRASHSLDLAPMRLDSHIGSISGHQACMTPCQIDRPVSSISFSMVRLRWPVGYLGLVWESSCCWLLMICFSPGGTCATCHRGRLPAVAEGFFFGGMPFSAHCSFPCSWGRAVNDCRMLAGTSRSRFIHGELGCGGFSVVRIWTRMLFHFAKSRKVNRPRMPRSSKSLDMGDVCKSLR